MSPVNLLPMCPVRTFPISPFPHFPISPFPHFPLTPISLANTTKPRAQKELVVGETYVFRVAASGGSTGQSYWSPEVIRGAA